MSKFTYITSSILIVFAVLFAILHSCYQEVWTGFAYFTLSFLVVLALFWGGLLIYRYFSQYKRELDERFKLYRAEKINSTKISADVFDASEVAYKKEFNKKLRLEKITKWFYILFCFACAVAFILCMIFM